MDFNPATSTGAGLLSLASRVFVSLAVLVVMYGILVAVCWILQSCFNRIPPEHRRMEPPLVWLLLIPCFNIVWIFFVFLKLPQSFKSYFDAQGITDVGDCGYGIGLAYCITACSGIVLGWIPCIGYLIPVAALVLLIIALTRFHALKNRIGAPA